MRLEKLACPGCGAPITGDFAPNQQIECNSCGVPLLLTQVADGATQAWQGWFLVHQDATDLRIKLDDLTYGQYDVVEAPLAIDNRLISGRGEIK